MSDEIEWVTRPGGSTQFYLFNLFADYIVPRGGRIWTNSLLYLLKLLGVNERAARTTLSRMRQQGWFETSRNGRQSQYAITNRGRAILAEGDKRIFEEPFTDWNGRWHLVVYSLPEEQRKLRNELRKKLIWWGFGRLAPGTWISPHNRQADLDYDLVELGVRDYVTQFTADSLADVDIVQKCWDIAELEVEYRDFVQRYQPEYETMQQALRVNRYGGKTAEVCFARRFWLTYNFQHFPRKDPHLPVELLPTNWIGFEARQLVLDYRQLLTEGMGDFMDEIVKNLRE